jgi:hypothetical protein
MNKRIRLSKVGRYLSVLLLIGGFAKPAGAQNKGLAAIDKELAKPAADAKDVQWVDARSLTIEGMGWNGAVADYARLPDKFKDVVTAKVWSLSRHSAGIEVRFKVKGTAAINARWKLTSNTFMAHMTPQSINGLDLYVKLNGKWIWAGVGRTSKEGLNQETILKAGFMKDKEYECMVYLPLYTGVSSLEIGVSKGAVISAAGANTSKPLVFYGTSILHGCSASRAGMTFAAMLGRKFDRPSINLGFSGNGQMDEPFGTILGEIDASIYFIDCLPNMSAFSVTEIKDRTLTLVRKLRALRPATPIVLVEDRTHTYANLTDNPVVNLRRPGLDAAYKILAKEFKGIYYVKGDPLLGDDNEATVDGSHPSDLGMYRYFKALSPLTSKLLK